MRVQINVAVDVEVENRARVTPRELVEKVTEASTDEIEALKSKMRQAATSILFYGEDRSYMTEDL